MRQRIILDTGPLVAFLDRRDAFHEWATRTFGALHAPFLTCEPVIAKTAFLVQHRPSAIEQIGAWIDAGFIRIGFSLESGGGAVFALMRKYRDLPMSLADACLVRMVETGIGDRVLTLDKHFRIYRHSGRRVVPVLLPE